MASTRRSDFARNRQVIFDVARRLFAERPEHEVQLEHVAEAAGIGRATLFRHIGSKQALVTALYRARMVDIENAADRALSCADPWDGLQLLFREVVRMAHEDRGLWSYGLRRTEQLERDPGHVAMVAKLARVLDRAQAAGHVRSGLAASDLPALFGTGAQWGWEGDASRLDLCVDILIQGIRAPECPAQKA
jgi:AcrR family transcriptional regulator